MRAIRVWAVAMLMALAHTGAATPVRAEQAFAAYTEIALRAGQDFPKWQDVRPRLAEETGAVRDCLGGQGCRSSIATEIAGRMQAFGEELPLAQAVAVHQMMNARPYREDRRQFGRSDVWQSPFAFWERGGDCEDYAIAKHMALSALGFSPSQLRLTVMTSRSRGEIHAVLLIEIGGAWYVSDNLKRELRRLDGYDRWSPVFSVGEAGAWRYVARPIANGQELASALPAATRRLPHSTQVRAKL